MHTGSRGSSFSHRYQPLLNWAEYRWEGDLTLLGEREAYQQLSVRAAPDSPWVSVRWILVRVPRTKATSDQWMVEAAFVEEPDGVMVGDVAPLGGGPPAGESGDELAAAFAAAAAAASKTPADVVREVMTAVRNRDEPYPLHGCEVAIRYCSPRNRASRLSPQSFAQYLDEPWYKILVEWDAIELGTPPAALPCPRHTTYPNPLALCPQMSPRRPAPTGAACFSRRSSSVRATTRGRLSAGASHATRDGG